MMPRRMWRIGHTPRKDSMKLCVVGNGPSAEGQGHEIDACEFVVRLKTFWLRGAENAGEKINAWVWAGDGLAKPLQCEHWFTHPPRQTKAPGYHKVRLDRFWKTAHGRPTRQMSDRLHRRAVDYLRTHPSTGFVAVAMAMERFEPDELVLVGFDSTTPDQPNFFDARGGSTYIAAHDIYLEKQAVLDISHRQRWMGRQTRTRLRWLHAPAVLPATRVWS